MSSHRPSRLYVLGVYTKRVLRWKRSNYPYLSGDAFADICEVVVFPPKYRMKEPSTEEILRAKSIFCRSDLLQSFLDEYSGRLSASVIIAGNSDQEFHEPLRNVPSSVKALFLQNSFISDNKSVFTLPIGIENFRLGVNGHPRLMRLRNRGYSVSKIMIGPFGDTHPLRKNIKTIYSEGGLFWDFYEGRISPRKFRKLSNKYKYVAAARGNGVDTHRLWECLYRGIVPILQEDKWLMSLPYILPYIKIVGTWEMKELEKCNESIPVHFDSQKIDELWVPFWENLIQSFIRA